MIVEPISGNDARPRDRATEAFASATTDFLVRRYELTDPSVIATIERLMSAIAEGHGCIELGGDDVGAGRFRSLGVTGLVSTIDRFDDTDSAPPASPLVLWDDRLFAQRQYVDERAVARSLVHRARRAFPALATPALLAVVDRVLPVLEPESAGGSPDDVANRLARSLLTSGFDVLTGGPGTGKTHTLVRSLALFARAFLDAEGRTPRIALCAPTGKAATRAREMIDAFATSSDTTDTDPRTALGDEAMAVVAGVEPQTVHRLLGRAPGTIAGFRHGPADPLDYDIVVVDETSMVPLALMTSLLGALGADTRLLLVGDDAQLESVELGAVLAQIARSAAPFERAAGRRVVHELTRVYRVEGGSAVGDLARAIRSGDEDDVIALLRRAVDGGARGITWSQSSRNTSVPRPVVERVADNLRQAVAIAREPRPADDEALRTALDVVGGTKVLCGPRHGVVGVENWNASIAARLGLDAPDLAPPGTPILVTVNAPHLGLVNGSIGLVVLIDAAEGPVPRVAFRIGDEIRTFDRATLPAWEPCFAMTVHKSQGSEYESLVVAALPGESSPLLTRELLYTAVTRAKSDVVVVGSEESIRAGVRNESSRDSGIAAMIEALGPADRA